MNMFGFDKFKEIAAKSVKRVVNTDFKLKKEESEPEEEEDFEQVLIQENKKLKAMVSSLLQEKEHISKELVDSTKALRKAEDENEDLRVKSLALASQKQILQMKYRFSGKLLHFQQVFLKFSLFCHKSRTS